MPFRLKISRYAPQRAFDNPALGSFSINCSNLIWSSSVARSAQPGAIGQNLESSSDMLTIVSREERFDGKSRFNSAKVGGCDSLTATHNVNAQPTNRQIG